MRVAEDTDLRPSIETFPLGQANEALARLRAGKLQGAAVLTPRGNNCRFRAIKYVRDSPVKQSRYAIITTLLQSA